MLLSHAEIRATIAEARERIRPDGKRILVVITDGTRSGPTALMCGMLREQLAGRARRLDFLIALGVEARAQALVASAPDQAEKIARQLARLIGRAQMGDLFKVSCLCTPDLSPPLFEDAT